MDIIGLLLVTALVAGGGLWLATRARRMNDMPLTLFAALYLVTAFLVGMAWWIDRKRKREGKELNALADKRATQPVTRVKLDDL